MFRELISFLRSPEEGRPFDFRPKSILSSFWLYLVSVMGLTILAAAVVYFLGEDFPALMQKKIVDPDIIPSYLIVLLLPQDILRRPSVNPNRHFTGCRSLPVSFSWKIYD